jgi:ATP-dependent Clp protease ATP-binding subunit ClpC
MFEKFTDNARKVMALANQEAKKSDDKYIETQHILLAIITESNGIGANVLKNLNVQEKDVKTEIEKLLKSSSDKSGSGKLPDTPRARRIIEYAIEEAKSLDHKHICTGHILLGILRDTESIAYEVLNNLGLRQDTVRKEVLSLIAGKSIEEIESIVM